MSVAVQVCFWTTLFYLYLSLDRDFYRENILSITRTDILLSIVLSSWAYFIVSYHFNTPLAVIVAVFSLGLSQLVMISNLIGNKNTPKVENGTDFVNTTVSAPQEAKTNPMTVLNGVEGKITEKAEGNYYIGYMGTGAVNSSIVVYSEEKMENGDRFVIDGVDGVKIKVHKL